MTTNLQGDTPTRLPRLTDDLRAELLKLYGGTTDSLYGLLDRIDAFALSESKRSTEALDWAVRTFGPIASNDVERALRFIEEAVELVHAVCVPRSIAEAMVNRVYSRPAGNLGMEIGQAMLTLELLGEAVGVEASAAADREFKRIQAIPKEEWARRHKAKADAGIAK